LRKTEQKTDLRATRVAVDVRIVKLLPAVKLLRTDDNQQLGRFPINVKMTFKIVGIPAIKHFEQDLIDLLIIGLGGP
jgi:hypothetical protein